MHFVKSSACAVALGAAMLSGCSMMGGGGGGGGAAAANPQVGTAQQPGVGETAGNVAIQAGASQAMKKGVGGAGGGLGYGVQSQAGNISRALFGKKKAPAPQQQPTDGTTSSSGSISTKK
jgi:hypothetical protein